MAAASSLAPSTRATNIAAVFILGTTGRSRTSVRDLFAFDRRVNVQALVSFRPSYTSNLKPQTSDRSPARQPVAETPHPSNKTYRTNSICQFRIHGIGFQ